MTVKRRGITTNMLATLSIWLRMRPLVNNKCHWERGTILKQIDKQSYDIESGSNVFRRNRADIRSTNKNSVSDTRENVEVNLPDIVHEPTTLRRSTRERTVPKYQKEYVT